jgi:hypothetical protein
MNNQGFPSGWDEARVKRLIDHYENMSDDEIIAEDEAACHAEGQNSHAFTLILSGIAEVTPELADAFYAATNGDIELNQRDGVVFLEFERAASTLRGAVVSAIREVEDAAVGVRVVRVESEAANVIAKINADLLGVAST